MVKLADFREILRYVPQFREQTFVLAVDQDVVRSSNFRNLLLDMALLRSVNIHLAIVLNMPFEGPRLPESATARALGCPNQPTSAEAMEQYLGDGNRELYAILSGLRAVDLQAATPNVVTSRAAGVLDGIDLLYSGRVQEIDVEPLHVLLKSGVIPVLPPFASDGAENDYRLDGDALALELALSVSALKIIYLTSVEGVVVEGRLRRQVTTSSLPGLLAETGAAIPRAVRAKLEYAAAAVKRGIERVHLINGVQDESLLAELFSNDGVGTLVYDDEYQTIRPATAEDVPAILALLQHAAVSDEVRRPSREAIEHAVENFFLFEIGGNPVGCAALYPYRRARKGELGSVAVGPGHQSLGIGRRLINHIEQQARQQGFTELLCLSTQAYNYFRQKAGFREGTAEDLPPARRREWLSNGRNSKILKKELA